MFKLARLLFGGTALLLMTAGSLSASEPLPVEYAVAIHGGAGAWSDITEGQRAEISRELLRVVTLGRDRLAAGEDGLDVVEAVIRELEDSPLFNAGRGSTFNAIGGHELDASIMDGRDLSCGAVASVTIVKNPISLARSVMTKTKHVLLVGDGADQFARTCGVELVDDDYFWTDATRARWEKFRTEQRGRTNSDHHGTVGCVVRDRQGNLAAGTSTGGMMGKRFGRVGDSPVVGAGTYADNATCAVSCTGTGEEFIRRAVAYDVAARMRYAGAALKDAVASQFDQRLKAGDGGIIAVDRDGRIALQSNTRWMARGCADSTGRLEAELGP